MIAPALALCSCPRTCRALLLAPMSDYRVSGGTTFFILWRCFDCGGLHATPPDNLTRAIERGTPHTLRRLRALARLH